MLEYDIGACLEICMTPVGNRDFLSRSADRKHYLPEWFDLSRHILLLL